MNVYRYTESGLDNVMIEGVDFLVDDAGETVVTIPNVNGLHKAIALGIITKKSGLSGKELQCLRTELRMTQAQMADLLHREPLAVSRWERNEVAVDPNAETIIRVYAAEKLDLSPDANIQEISGWCVPSAETPPLVIDGADPSNYTPKLAA